MEILVRCCVCTREEMLAVEWDSIVGSILADNDYSATDDGTICGSCRARGTCDACKQYVGVDNLSQMGHGDFYCGPCFDEAI